MNTPQDQLRSEGKDCIQHFEEELQKIRTGRAQTSLVSHLFVDAYGTSTPLEGLASIAVPESRTLTITPWDKNVLKDIEKAIRDASTLGLNPVNEGDMIRINLPELTQERRTELVKVVHEKSEEARIALRAVREKIMKTIKNNQKDGTISEDVAKRQQDDCEKAFQELQKTIEDVRQKKEDELLTL